ncbi:hypothetical protein GCM10018785_16910 [Streptomyces longispororuber]|uniref:Uncharacterized protein n=1 Tax=Streptomyces longispororuber TaxID=68230 RepID=A0A918ZEB5_9ACTN|nr:hypothetical protein GCM10018785_16910 [Streptomyces longispororuber]
MQALALARARARKRKWVREWKRVWARKRKRARVRKKKRTRTRTRRGRPGRSLPVRAALTARPTLLYVSIRNGTKVHATYTGPHGNPGFRSPARPFGGTPA